MNMKLKMPRRLLPLLLALVLTLAGSAVQAHPAGLAAGPQRPVPHLGTCQGVSWTNLQNAVANGATITRTSPGYAWDASGYSSEALVGDGSLSLTADNTTDFRMVGLTQADYGPGWQNYEYAWYIAGQINGHHSLQVLVRGVEVYQIDDYTLGDRVQLTISDHLVTWRQNGTAVYSITTQSPYPWHANVALFNPGAHVTVSICGTLTPLPPGCAYSGWENASSELIIEANLLRRDNSSGWNAGARTQTTLYGDGSVNYVIDRVDNQDNAKAFGLITFDINPTYVNLPVAWVLANGVLAVEEYGQIRTSTAQYRAGDTLALTLTGDRVAWTRNGDLVYASTLNHDGVPVHGEGILRDAYTEMILSLCGATTAPTATATPNLDATGTAVAATMTAISQITGTAAAQTATAQAQGTGTAVVQTATAQAGGTGTAVAQTGTAVAATTTAISQITGTSVVQTATAQAQGTGTAVVQTATAQAQGTGTAVAQTGTVVAATATAISQITGTAGVQTATAQAGGTGTAVAQTATAQAGGTGTAVAQTGTAVAATTTAISQITGTAGVQTATAQAGGTGTAVVQTATAQAGGTGTAVAQTGTAVAATTTAISQITGTAGVQTATAQAQGTGTAVAQTATSVAGTLTAQPTQTAVIVHGSPTVLYGSPTVITTVIITSQTPTATATACTLTFSDVASDYVFAAPIRTLACFTIITGYSDGTYRPGNLVTRAQIAKIVVGSAATADALSGQPTQYWTQPLAATQQSFTDITPGTTFWSFVERLARQGAISGYDCGSRAAEPCDAGRHPYFRPSAPATRGQISKIMALAAGWNGHATGQQFADVAPGYVFYGAIQWMAGQNIINGYDCGATGEPCSAGAFYFRPGAPVTRGQTAKIAANTYLPGYNPRRVQP